jgi:hypothetical protein
VPSDAERGYLSADDCRLADFDDLVSQKTDLARYPGASAIDQNVLGFAREIWLQQYCD